MWPEVWSLAIELSLMLASKYSSGDKGLVLLLGCLTFRFMTIGKSVYEDEARSRLSAVWCSQGRGKGRPSDDWYRSLWCPFKLPLVIVKGFDFAMSGRIVPRSQPAPKATETSRRVISFLHSLETCWRSLVKFSVLV